MLVWLKTDIIDISDDKKTKLFVPALLWNKNKKHKTRTNWIVGLQLNNVSESSPSPSKTTKKWTYSQFQTLGAYFSFHYCA